MGVYFKFINWLRSKFPDPVYECSLYKDCGCSHIDGLLCDFPDCKMNKDYEKEKNEVDILTFSQFDFDDYCEKNHINDGNVEKHTDKAFISIIGTPEVLKDYLQEPHTEHWFKENHPNVLNLEFDDVSKDRVFGDIHAYAITEEQAEKCVNFIEQNIGKTFIIHCRAGMSRSAAISMFLHDFIEGYENIKGREYLKKTWPNSDVSAKLKRVWYKKNKFFV